MIAAVFFRSHSITRLVVGHLFAVAFLGYTALAVKGELEDLGIVSEPALGTKSPSPNARVLIQLKKRLRARASANVSHRVAVTVRGERNLRSQHVSLPSALSSVADAEQKGECANDYAVPTDDLSGKSSLHVSTSESFLKLGDPYWTLTTVKRYYNPEASAPYRIAPSPINRCGITAARLIRRDEPIGIIWVPGDRSNEFEQSFGENGMSQLLLTLVHITPWFGRILNHCSDANAYVERLQDGSVWAKARIDIPEGEEVLLDYQKVHEQYPEYVQPPDPSWTCTRKTPQSTARLRSTASK
eukprot:TRINITY_DN13126_c0_g1_i8.p1 TRINITY_DN13126_c0_g1~~TRINITY_DN13126_c0_g1_i8.p1  ORF type:complete len:300 (-),score=25.69 TRINITY_DN13126_c0_g1_i8:11-910(-)